jgi:hypothetical protein
LIEVKDYRRHPRTKPSDLAEEVSAKVLHTLAAMLPAMVNGNDASEADFARSVLNARKLKVISHLEQPAKHSKLFPRAIDPVDIQTKMRQPLKPIDPHALVTESLSMRNVPWQVH